MVEVIVPPPSPTRSVVTAPVSMISPSIRFIAGEPMNCATNSELGRS